MRLLTILVLSLTASASQEPLRNDPKRPVEKIARDLNIKPEKFVACFANVQPAPQGTKPTADRVHANKKILLSCLLEANAAITNEKLDEVMDRYRPAGLESPARARGAALKRRQCTE